MYSDMHRTGNYPVIISVVLVSLICSLFFFSCGGGSSSEPQDGNNQPQDGDTRGTILDMISSSTSPDSDGDYLPDDVEEYLGTDPYDRDTDHDGIPDFVEIFGPGLVDENAVLTDENGNGLISALDRDDNGDDINDGEQVDSDEDGISNYLEYYGFTYNWMSGQYTPWDGEDFSVEYFKTDPHQKSTDQDPFDDNVEVTGVNMDVSVKDPGDKPMVPAYPDIYVRLEGYSVTLNQEITWTEGSSLANGTTWERTAESNHSNTTEKNWEIGVSSTASFGMTGPSGSVTYHANYGESYGSTSGSSYSVASGGSITSEQNWSRASMSNPTDAAHIKLFLKVYNKGTAVASSVIPTITLKIGGHNIATFEQGNAQINLLEPGGVYPETPGVYWVVDSIDTGAGIAPISLTLGELKALENGAPISITLTQMTANVMLRNTQTGAYESVGDWNEYMARIKAVSANLFFDIGDGNMDRSYVYADDSITSPIVTLGDAMVWTAGGRQDPSTGDIFITYYDERSGSYQETSIDGWHFAMDGGTYEANGFTAADPMPAGFNIAALRLNPHSVVVAKAPRDHVPGAGDIPEILAAYFDPTTESVTAVASDYNGIASVEFIDKLENARPMQEDIPGSSFYVYAPAHDSVNYPDGYEFNGAERVRVTNVNGDSTERLFIQVYTPPVPEPPVFTSVSVDLALHKLYAHVESDTPLDAAPAFVRAYSDIFQSPNFQDGYCEMTRVSNWFEDPTGWVCDLDPAWITFAQIAGTTVVAYAGPDLMAYRDVTDADQFIHTNGEGIMWSMIDRSNGFCWPNNYKEVFDAIDLDTGDPYWYGSASYLGRYFSLPSQPGYGAVDAWIKGWDENRLDFYFSIDSVYYGKDGDPGVDFNAITRGDIQGKLLTPPDETTGMTDYNITRVAGGIYVYKTVDGRYGKLRLNNFSWYWGGNTIHGIYLPCVATGGVDYRFVTFQP